MADLRFTTTTGKETILKKDAMEKLRSGFRGNLLGPKDSGYDTARTVWNGMIDRKPSLIARCSGAADVMRAVQFAREHDLLTSIRGGGHSVAGKAVADDSLMIDLSPMRWVRVEPASRMAFAGPGTTLGDFDHETQAFGLATPVGINSTTGIAGLTLGGGFGWISRKYGLTIDNLVSAEVVTAVGKLVTANEKENDDLFWAIRGGGGNFGIVTSFQYRLHSLGPQVMSGLIVHPFRDAKEVLRFYRDFVAQAPEELTCWVVLRQAPPLPFLPSEFHGKEIVVLAVVYAGDPQKSEQPLQPLRKFGKPIADVIMPGPFTGFQQAFDPMLTPGARNYWKSHNFTSLDDAAFDVLIEYTEKLPTPLSEIFIGHLGGAVNRVPADATAYPHRDVDFIMNVHTRWEDPSQDEKCIAWSRNFFDATARFATGGVYVNFISEGEDRISSAFGGNYERLAKLKKKYDPTNFFRINQNIQPAG